MVKGNKKNKGIRFNFETPNQTRQKRNMSANDSDPSESPEHKKQQIAANAGAISEVGNLASEINVPSVTPSTSVVSSSSAGASGVTPPPVTVASSSHSASVSGVTHVSMAGSSTTHPPVSTSNTITSTSPVASSTYTSSQGAMTGPHLPDYNTLMREVMSLRAEVNELKQYSRRNSLRISNANWPERPYENTDLLVLELSSELGLNLAPWMIDRSHRVGRRMGKPRDILVKFIGYGPRNALYQARQNLRADPRFRGRHPIFINEDLSPETSKLLYEARMMKKTGAIHSCSTRDGRVLVSRFNGDRGVVVKSLDELKNITTGSFSRVAAGPRVQGPIGQRFANIAGYSLYQTPPLAPMSNNANATPASSVATVPPPSTSSGAPVPPVSSASTTTTGGTTPNIPHMSVTTSAVPHTPAPTTTVTAVSTPISSVGPMFTSTPCSQPSHDVTNMTNNTGSSSPADSGGGAMDTTNAPYLSLPTQ